MTSKTASMIRATVCALLVGVLADAAKAQTFFAPWSKTYGATVTTGKAVAVDGSNRSIVAGTFQATVDFGDGPVASAGGNDVFVTMLDASGAHVWTRIFGGTAGDDAGDVEVDEAGNVYVTGAFAGAVDFGGGILTSAGNVDVFVVKLGPDGNHVWSRRYGGTSDDRGVGIALDASGNPFVTGSFAGDVDFGRGILTGVGRSDAFLLSLDVDGATGWSVQFGVSDHEEIGLDVVVDPSGVIYAAINEEWYSVIDDFSVGHLIKYDANGGVLWDRHPAESIFDIALDAFGDIAVAALWRRYEPNGEEDYHVYVNPKVVQYDASGSQRWSKLFISDERGYALGVSTDPAGNIYVVGGMQSTDFGGGELVTQGGFDAFLLELDRDGEHVWSQRFGGVGDDVGNAVAVGDDGNLTWVGYFANTIDFGDARHVSEGSRDAFVARGGPAGYFALSIHDVPDDQGRAVMISFPHSGYDSASSPRPIVQYEFFLRDDPVARAQISAVDPVSMISDRAVLDQGWIFVHSVPASMRDTYDEVVPTMADSTIVAGMHESVFFVRAATADPYGYFDTQAITGYSVDNLVPTAPSGFAYTRPLLTWGPPVDADFDYFTAYGSMRPTLDATAVVLANTTQNTVDVAAKPYTYYYVRATDFSGNPGRLSTVPGEPDVTAPSPPVALAYVAGVLRWTAPPETDLEHYAVQGSMTSVFDGSQTFIENTQQTSSNVEMSGFSYFFVTSVDLLGNTSAPSMTRENYPPAPPVILAFDGATLTWEASTDAAFDHYTVYGSTTPFLTSYTVLIPNTTATSANLLNFTHYAFYFVTVTDRAGNESTASATSDHVAPDAPENVQYDGSHVSWDASSAVDIDRYNVFGSNSSAFGQNTKLIGGTQSTSLDVASKAYRYFYVTARDLAGNESGATRVDDNVAPPPPAGVYRQGDWVAWEASPAADVAHYTVYGSTSDDFGEPKTEVVRTTAKAVVVSGDDFAYFFVTANDLWGNESDGTLATDKALPTTLSLSAFPNPFNPETTIRYELPRGGNASVAIYDARGALVATLVRGSHDAGSYDVKWNGLATSGDPVGSGVYFARLNFSGDVKTRKLVLLK